jgi:ribosome assembly protein YihI (activator of Der GTPase)
MINATVAGHGGNRRRSRALSRENIRQDMRRGSRAGSRSNVLDIDGLDGTLRSAGRCGSKANIFETVGSENKDQKDKVLAPFLCLVDI